MGTVCALWPRAGKTAWASMGVRISHILPPARRGRADDPQQAPWGLPSHPHPQTPLTQPDISLEGHQHIASFQVPVDDLLAVQKVEGF